MERPPLVLVGGRLCLDFCNTAENRRTDRYLDLLKHGYASLVRWSYGTGILQEDVADRLAEAGKIAPERAQAVFQEAIVLREAIFLLFDALIDGREASAEQLWPVNMATAEFSSRRRLTIAPGHKVIWEWLEPEALDAMLGPVVISALAVLEEDDLGRIRRCPSCGWLFYDQSKNHSRTWCDMQLCGNRAKARRHFQRMKSSRNSDSR